ncbi:MAG: hypothetical protein K6A78_00820, partial [Prevotella sp.]|nr:hypothetical protein [Prevotella sp.]
EGGPDIADWVPRNNWYVLHNRIYYRSADEPANGAKSYSEYIPTLFGIAQNAKQEDISVMPVNVTVDGCVYDLFGRKVIAAEEMSDNQWRQRLSPGLYIVNGKKIQINGK